MPPQSAKVFVVTGGATSIGAGVVRALAARGDQVVIADIADAEGVALAGSLGGKHRFTHCDLACDDDIAHCIADAAEVFGGIDGVVHAATSYLDGGIAANRDAWRRSLDVNLIGGAMIVAHAVPHIQARGGGSVVLFGSISAKIAQAGRWLYPAGKAALLQLARSMALDFAGLRIRVNTVSPGKTWSTPLQRKYAGNRATADRAEGHLHLPGRIADEEEVAAAVLFLCSDEARFITGSDIAVDGGYSAMGPEGRESPAIASAEGNGFTTRINEEN